MKISYDPEVDAMYIQLIEGHHECRTIRLSDEVALDIGPDEQLVGVEILDAKEILGLESPATIKLENVLTRAS